MPAAAEPTPRATRCPACQGTDLVTTSKPTDAAPYWRCLKCGEIWNTARRAAATSSPRYDYRR